ILQERNGHLRAKTARDFVLTHVVDTDLTRPRPVTLPEGVLHNNLNALLADRQVEIVAELIGGTTIAADVVLALLAAGKDVVTANKALLAERGEEIFAAARRHGRCVAFEASCCGGMPIVGALSTGLVANRISAIYGIVNGTCNYILSEMSHRAKDYQTALKEAQAAGFAEADPSLDVNGTDSAHKIAILALLAFGCQVDFSGIPVRGIDTLGLEDIHYGRELGYAIKLLAIAEQTAEGLSLRVHPAFVSRAEPLAQVSGPFNAVSVFGDAVGHTSYYGRGAGMMPTASAVVADMVDIAQGNAARRFTAACGLGRPAQRVAICPAEQVASRYYLRFCVVDQPGVFVQIARVLSERQISISACLQHESASAERVPVVIMTHRARQGDVVEALRQIEQLPVVKAEPVCIPVITPPQEEC
ncbi:MAG: homoserine dehydrogenase, partial [Sedimentisphaerales bacterium]|nr:homoserine dehydrogenase [Sedimentisphaerales bacterium]